MSTLAAIEKSVPQFSAEELEQIIRKARREKEQARKPSLRDTGPVSGRHYSQTDWDTRRVVWQMLEGRYA
jgi:hypothetical protein